MANLITRMVDMEIVGNSVENDKYIRDFIAKLMWRLSGFSRRNHITRRSAYKKYHSPYNLHTVYIVSTYYGDEIFFSGCLQIFAIVFFYYPPNIIDVGQKTNSYRHLKMID